MRARLLLPIAALLATPATGGIIANRIYPAPTTPLSLSGLPANAELITVTTADRLTLKGIAVPAQAGQPTLLVFHGNGSSASTTITWLAPLLAQGYGVIAAEYRGYAGNPGSPSESGLNADADAFYAYARTKAGADPLWVVGHSLGGGVAFGLARRQRLDALVTIGTFTDLRAMAPRLARAFITDRYNNLGAIAGLDEPLILIHGLHDEIVPYTAGKLLGEAARAADKPGFVYFIDAADHHPDGTVVAAIIADARARLAQQAAGPALAGVQIFPLGALAR